MDKTGNGKITQERGMHMTGQEMIFSNGAQPAQAGRRLTHPTVSATWQGMYQHIKRTAQDLGFLHEQSLSLATNRHKPAETPEAGTRHRLI
jgi:hypothetical protein